MSNTIEGSLPPAAAGIANEAVNPTSRTNPKTPANDGTVKDTSQVSGDSELYTNLVAQLKTMPPPTRASKVGELKAQIAAGAYNPDLNQVAGAIAKGLAGE
ncbi:MAG: flagellar biosynthesis anti-sigma factor FlgM [Candidatus Binataceae bacterium]